MPAFQASTLNITPQAPLSEPKNIRALITGFEKSGKTFNAILWALWFLGIDPLGWTKEQVHEFAKTSPVVVLETSKEDVTLYMDVLPFRVIHVPPEGNSLAVITRIARELEQKDPYVKAVVVDSFSEFWEGEGGVLSYVQEQGDKNSLQAWNNVKKMEAAQLNALRDSKLDFWFTARMKDGVRVEVSDSGATSFIKERDRPITRRSAPYEFSQLLHLDNDDGKLATQFFGRYLEQGKNMSGKKFKTDDVKQAKAFMGGIAGFLHRDWSV